MLKIEAETFLLDLYKKFEDDASDGEIAQYWSSKQGSCEPSGTGRDFEPTAEQMQALRKDFETAVSANRAAKAVNVQQWFKSNPHLPQPSLGMIHKFLWMAKDCEEQCKRVLKRYYCLRGTDDEIFGDRDPCSPDAQKLHQVSNFACLSTLTKEVYRISISVLTDYDAEKFCPKEWVRRIFYIADLRVRDDFCLGDIMIYDLQGFTVQHLVKFQFTLARKMIYAAEGGLPTRIKQIHMINCPPFIDKVTSIFKPFLKEKIAARVVIHMDGYQQLYNYIAKETLPEEYGGTAGTMAEHSTLWLNQFKENREWFLTEEKNIKRIYLEGRKAGKLLDDTEDLFGADGSFKQLAID